MNTEVYFKTSSFEVVITEVIFPWAADWGCSWILVHKHVTSYTFKPAAWQEQNCAMVDCKSRQRIVLLAE